MLNIVRKIILNQGLTISKHEPCRLGALVTPQRRKEEAPGGTRKELFVIFVLVLPIWDQISISIRVNFYMVILFTRTAN